MPKFVSRKVIGALLVLGLTPALAQAEGCKINALQLDCGSGGAAISKALAAPETARTLQSPALVIDQFVRPSDMEVFRKSIEKQWLKVNREARKQERNLRRKRISNEEFETWRSVYAAARENYDRAINFYRRLVWLGKTGKPARADG